MSVNGKMTAIADNIRSKTGGTEALTLDDMASSVNDVYEAGRQAEYDAFWDAFQNEGKPMSWGSYTFGGTWWNDKTFNPKYDIITGAGAATYYFLNNRVTNLRDKIDRRGLKLDVITGKTASIQGLFEGCSSVEAPDFDSGTITDMSSLCYNCTKMHTVPRLNMTKCTKAGAMFYKAEALRNITFEGTIPISISFSYSPLTVESMKSIITHLKDYTGTESEFVYTVTFKTSAFSALEEEGATAEYNGVACTWAELIGFLKWNLVKA